MNIIQELTDADLGAVSGGADTASGKDDQHPDVTVTDPVNPYDPAEIAG